MNNINLQMAWRNIWRNKLRSSVVIAAITVGLFGGLSASGISKGMVVDMINNALENTVSHIQIHEPEYQKNNEIIYRIQNSNELIKKLKETEGVKAVCQRSKSFGMASTASKATGVIINGIEPEKEKQVTQIYNKLTDSLSSYFTSKRKNRIIISQKLAKKLNARVKSKIVLTFQDYQGNLTGASFKVEGIYKTQNTMFDEQNVFVRKADLDRLLIIPKNSAHEIAIMLNDYKQTQKIIDKIRQFTNYKVEAWFTIDPYLKMMSSLTNYMLFIFMGIILLALAFGIINTMLMVVLERKKEMGMIMAIGMNKKKVFTMIMQETTMLSMVGGIIGVIVSILFIQYFGKNGIDISMVGKGFGSMGMSTVMHPFLEVLDYIEVIILVFITGIISSIFPTIRAIKMNPAEAIRTD